MADDELHFCWDDGKAAANLEKHGVSFETATGQTSDSSIESDLAPVYCDETPGKAFYFRLKLQDNALRKPVEIDGTIKAPISPKEGY